MPPLTGKDAILAAARRLAELGDDDFDEDLLDAELALLGPLHDDEEIEETEAALRPEDLGLPLRLAAWLAKHRGRDMRVAFGAAFRAAKKLETDKDGHVKLGREVGRASSSLGNGASSSAPRQKYKPLEERVVPVSVDAKPTPRDFEYVSPAELERQAERDKHKQTQEQWQAGERAFVKNNDCKNEVVKKIIANSVRREREQDLPKGAGPAGRHEPTTRHDTGQAAVMGKSLLDIIKPASGELKTAEKLSAAQRRLNANALLSKLPKGERPVIATSHEQMCGGIVKKNGLQKVSRTTRQATLDALVVAAIVHEAKQRGVDKTSINEKFLLARPKTRAKAIQAGVDAELWVYEQSSSVLAYRGLAANALRSVGATVGDTSKDSKDASLKSHTGDANETENIYPSDAFSVVPLAARRKETADENGLSAADLYAVSVAVSFERSAQLVVDKKRKGVGFVGFSRPGALLQNYESLEAKKIYLKKARHVHGNFSTSFWKETLHWQRPPNAFRTRKAFTDEVIRRRLLRKKSSGDEGTVVASTVLKNSLKEKKVRKTSDDPVMNTSDPINPDIIPGDPLVISAVETLIISFIQPFLDVGTVTKSNAESITQKAVSKVMKKKQNEKSCDFLKRNKERDAVKALVREYIRRGMSDAPNTKRRKVEEKPTFNFDVDDL